MLQDTMANLAFDLFYPRTVTKARLKMDNDQGFKHIIIKEIHPTFAAEVRGVDFSSPVADDVFAEILSAITKV